MGEEHTGGVSGTGWRREVELCSLSHAMFGSSGTRTHNAAPECESVEPRNEHKPICGSADGPLTSLEEIRAKAHSR